VARAAEECGFDGFFRSDHYRAIGGGTDRDDDGLPENTDVGHGWIEGGPLAGGAVTSYVAAVWVAAAESLAWVARVLGEEAIAARCAGAAERARRAFDERLFDEETGRYALHRDADDTLISDLTALAAVPIALRVGARASAADATLDALASDEFTTPWGVRLVARSDPRYSPTQYHGGAVWPLYTGWVALAEFAAHRQEAGYRHLLANAMLCYDRAKGAFDEALSGDTLAPAGVCPDQAWSAAMVVLPLVDGMLGAEPDAPGRRLRLTPHWPREWTHAVVGPLRVGDAQLEVEATEGCLVAGVPHDGVHYRLRVSTGGGLTVVLEHPVEGRSFERVMVNGAMVPHEDCGTPSCRHVRVTLPVEEATDVQFVGDVIAG
jgi:glycogen debranching enzyme